MGSLLSMAIEKLENMALVVFVGSIIDDKEKERKRGPGRDRDGEILLGLLDVGMGFQ